MHFPQLVPEVLIIPFLFLLNSKRKSFNFDRGLFIKLFFISLILLAIALGYGKYQIGGIISLYRSFLYLIFAICLFNTPNDITLDNILWMMLGSILGWFYVARTHFASLIIDLDNNELTYGLLLAFPLFLSITFSKKKYLLLATGLLLSTGIFVFAGLRRTIIVFIVSLLATFFIEFLGNMKKLFQIVLVSLSLAFVITTFSSQIESFVYDASPQLHYRMYVRTEETLSGNAGRADTQRLDHISSITEQGIEMFFPKGIYTNHTSEEGAGKYNDYPLSALVWMLGLPFTLLLMIYFLGLFRRSCKYFIRTNDNDVSPFLVSFIVMGVMLFLDGTFLTYVYCAPITGICIGKLLYYSNCTKYDNYSI